MKNIAVFDFDGTIIRGDSVVALVSYARKSKCIGAKDLFRSMLFGALYACRLVPAMKAKEASHAFLAKLSKEKREALLKDFAKTLIDRAFPAAIAQFEAHRKAGDTLLICSASCHCYMQYVADLLRADALLCTASTPEGEAAGDNCRGEEKVARVNAWLRENALGDAVLIAGYGDSGADAYILSRCKEPVLVNPKRKLLKRLPNAKVVHWTEK